MLAAFTAFSMPCWLAIIPSSRDSFRPVEAGPRFFRPLWEMSPKSTFVDEATAERRREDEQSERREPEPGSARRAPALERLGPPAALPQCSSWSRRRHSGRAIIPRCPRRRAAPIPSDEPFREDARMATPEQIRDTMPFAALIGAELTEATPEVVRGRMEWAPERCTAGGLLHGGALMALADGSGGVLAFLNLPEGAIGTATIESKTNFMRGVREGAVVATTRAAAHGAHDDRDRDRARARERRRARREGHPDPGLPLPARLIRRARPRRPAARIGCRR